MHQKPTYLESQIHLKEWGYEEWIVNSPFYCMKYLCFLQDKKCSMHFHLQKDETWTVLQGKFIFRWIDTKNASLHEEILKINQIIHIPIGLPHQLVCLEEGKILEVSTHHKEEDSYRIEKGDSQNP